MKAVFVKESDDLRSQGDSSDSGGIHRPVFTPVHLTEDETQPSMLKIDVINKTGERTLSTNTFEKPSMMIYTDRSVVDSDDKLLRISKANVYTK